MTHEQHPDLTIEGSTRGKSDNCWKNKKKGTIKKLKKITFWKSIFLKILDSVCVLCIQ
ncbi:hypothetical protein V6Z12_A01G215800 [Gossypium hirsutum]